MINALYRGKRADNGEWVQGWLKPYQNGGYDDIKEYPRLCIQNGYLSKDIYEVIPETVGQWTGLTDKNGIKIFDGDIVQYQPEYSTEPISSVVEYCVEKYNYPAFDLKNHDYEANGLQCAHEEGEGCEVIGNFYDNSDLLE